MNDVLICLGDCDCDHCKAQQLEDMCLKIQVFLVPPDRIRKDGTFLDSDAKHVATLVMQ